MLASPQSIRYEVRYLTNRFHFCVRLYCNRSQTRVKNKKVRTRRSRVRDFLFLHAMASSVIYRVSQKTPKTIENDLLLTFECPSTC